jgi:hypothetical protein
VRGASLVDVAAGGASLDVCGTSLDALDTCDDSLDEGLADVSLTCSERRGSLVELTEALDGVSAGACDAALGMERSLT